MSGDIRAMRPAIPPGADQSPRRARKTSAVANGHARIDQHEAARRQASGRPQMLANAAHAARRDARHTGTSAPSDPRSQGS